MRRLRSINKTINLAIFLDNVVVDSSIIVVDNPF